MSDEMFPAEEKQPPTPKAHLEFLQGFVEREEQKLLETGNLKVRLPAFFYTLHVRNIKMSLFCMNLFCR